MQALLRLTGVLLAALLLPPAAVALGGGADLDLGSDLRVAWYDAAGPGLGLLAALLVAGLPSRGSAARVLLGLGLASVATVAWVTWVGEIESELLSVSRTERPGLVGLVLVALGCGVGGVRGRSAPAFRPVLMGSAAGAVLLFGVDRLDLRLLAQQIPGEPPASQTTGAEEAARPDVVLILVDTLRADALGAYGAEPSPTPFLDALLAEARVYEQAIAQAPWTFPSMASLFTSRHPSTLHPQGRGRAMDDDEGMPRLAPEAPRLAEHLRAAGYHTAGFQKNPYLGPGSGFERGFDVYEMVGGDTAEDESAAQVTGAALRWARAAGEARASKRLGPAFLFVHYMDPHIDYRPPRRYWQEDTRAYEGFVDGSQDSIDEVRKTEGGPEPEDLAQLRRLYRDEVRYLDGQIRRLVGGLGARGLLGDDAILVLTADHGEQFYEHGAFKHHHVWIENVHVPLAIRAPGLAPGREPGVVALLDVVPTVLDLAGLPPLPGAEGRSLAGAGPSGSAVTEFGDTLRLTTEAWSAIRENGGPVRLFDRRADPGEQRDVRPAREEVATRLGARLRAHAGREEASEARPRAPTRGPLDPAMRRKLEALGYLDAGVVAEPGAEGPADRRGTAGSPESGSGATGREAERLR